ncbi:MAG: cadherin-like domain-containing protein, partial [Snowella sp.]|nr:cadherin-like domain-containing protein [Snowella sp.]
MANSINPLIDLDVLKSILKLLSSDSLGSQIYQYLQTLTDDNLGKNNLNTQQNSLDHPTSPKTTNSLPKPISTVALSSNPNGTTSDSEILKSAQPSTTSLTSLAPTATVSSVSSTSLATTSVSKYRIEAESLTNRSVYRLESISAASGGQVLSFLGGATNEVGTATFQFTGETGYYDVVIGTFDENDGQARFDVSQNGSAIGSITLNQDLGSNIASAQTAVARKVTTVYIKQGDTFTVKGTENGDEHARLDYIDLIRANTPPVGTGDSATTTQNQAVTLLASNLLANDTDADGDQLTLSSVKNAVNGSVALNASGNPVFTPTANFTGNGSFDYVVSDGRGGTATATVKVLVNPVTLTKVRVEAESIANPSVYRVESISAASGGQVLSFLGGATNEVGTATFQFTGETGYYDVV